VISIQVAGVTRTVKKGSRIEIFYYYPDFLKPMALNYIAGNISDKNASNISYKDRGLYTDILGFMPNKYTIVGMYI
jgi:hypothetical protein